MAHTRSLLLTAAFLCPWFTHAGDVVLGQASLNSGGGTMEGGGIVLQASLGQSVVDFGTGGEVALQSGFWTGRIEVIIEYANAFEEWMDQLPAADKPPEGQRGPDDTPAGDGVSNLLKFAFGLLPLNPAADALPSLIVDADDFVGLTFVRSADAEVTFALYGSTDLQDWTEIPFVETVLTPGLPNNREQIQLLSGLKQSGEDRYFFRLKVVVD